MKENEAEMCFLLVTGRRRSGTTFFSNFLNVQEKTTVYRDLFKTQLELINTTSQSYLFDSALTDSQVKQKVESLEKECNLLNLEHRIELSDTQFNTFKEFYIEALSQLSKNGDVIVGHKATEVENVYDEILQIPNFKIIYIVRDIRDVVNSMRQKFNRVNSNKVVKEWANSIKEITKNKSDNLLVIKHEDIIGKKKETIDSLEEFLGYKLDFNFSQLNDYNKDWTNNSSFGDVSGVFDQKTIYRWRSNQKDSLIRYAYTQAEDILLELGYDEMHRLNTFAKIMVMIRNYYSAKTYRIRNKLYKTDWLVNLYRKFSRK
jgi:hypothetical protein